jgi:hypothetical protein
MQNTGRVSMPARPCNAKALETGQGSCLHNCGFCGQIFSLKQTAENNENNVPIESIRWILSCSNATTFVLRVEAI